jgi:hypothetical protein
MMTGTENGPVPIVKALLSEGADPNLARSDGLTGEMKCVCMCAGDGGGGGMGRGGSGCVDPFDDGSGKGIGPDRQSVSTGKNKSKFVTEVWADKSGSSDTPSLILTPPFPSS